MRRVQPVSLTQPKISRRGLIAGALAAGGLFVGWTLWPKKYSPNLATAPGETILGGYVKVGRDGHVTVICPQVEMGQGSATLVAQIVADELGADWRTVAVEPAPLNLLYDNELLAHNWKDGWLPAPQLQATGGSTTLRAFETKLRKSAAGARILLSKAAGARLDADWQACETEEGFVVRGNDRLRFADLAEEAAGFSLPETIVFRNSGTRLAGQSVPRLDIPAKLDGSLNYAADVRLPDLLYAAIRQGPPGNTTLKSFNEKAAKATPGVSKIVKQDRWIAVVAETWWSANRALDAGGARFETAGGFKTQKQVTFALEKALKADGKVVAEVGDALTLLASGAPVTRAYAVNFAPHVALEPMAATARLDGDGLQLWIATQAPGLARAAAARAIGLDEDDVAVHAMQVGGSFGRKYEVEIAAQVAILAKEMGQPVQLVWSRQEDMAHDRMRPAASARVTAKLAAGGKIDAWRADIAAPDSLGELIERNLVGTLPEEARQSVLGKANARAVDGAIPPYAIPAYSILHHPADGGIPTGKVRGGAHGYTAFFTECFIDELAKMFNRDGFSFRMGLLAGNPRLARCLTEVTTRGGWNGGAQGTNQGLACHVMLGSFIAVLAEAQMGDDGRARVAKLTAVADVGRVTNPAIALQQIEGGLMFGLGIATGTPIRLEGGIPEPRSIGALKLPLLADMPEVSVKLIRSSEAAGGIGEIAVPPVGPAIANALFAATGQRFRSLPLGNGTS